jgi:PPE-repeat protein
VPPPVIAANRALLATLIATNFLGQNSPAIAATEAQYMEMWAQDAGAMYGYAASSTSASQMTPFTAPPETTTPDGESGQFAAVAQATTQQAGNTAQTAANTSSQLATPQAFSASAPQAAHQLTAAAAAPTTTGTSLQDILPSPTNWWSLTPGNYTAIIKQTLQAYFGVGIGNFGWSIGQQLTTGPGGATAGAGGAWFPTPQFAQLGLGNLGSVGTASSVTAGTGQAAQVGGLSVPQQWATLASTVSPADAAEAEAAPIQTVPASSPPGNALLRGMPTGAVGRRAGAAAGYSHKYGFRYSVLTRPPSAG